jgi:iron complex transport system permease protein
VHFEQTITTSSSVAVDDPPVPTAADLLGLARRRWLLLAMLLLWFLLMGLSLALGSVDIPLAQVVKILLGETPDTASWSTIVWKYRLPKAITASLAGAALTASGLQMQTLFRNPLAGPYVLGISSGASLGVALVVLVAGGGSSAALLAGLGLLGDLGVAVAATLGAGLVMALVLLVARWVEDSTTLLLLGMLFGYAASAVVSVLLYFAMAERVQSYVIWTFGSFGDVTWNQLQVLAPTILAGLLLAGLAVKQLNALLLGDTYALSMGVAVGRTRLLIIVSASLLAGVVTAFCGPVAFIGVAVPHLCRALLGTADHRFLVPAAILIGAVTALVADLVTQMPGSQTVLPLNAVTALIGAPVLAWVLIRRRIHGGWRD